MSGSWVGRPSWITDVRGVAAGVTVEASVGVVREEFSVSLTAQSCHFSEAQEIYR